MIRAGWQSLYCPSLKQAEKINLLHRLPAPTLDRVNNCQWQGVCGCREGFFFFCMLMCAGLATDRQAKDLPVSEAKSGLEFPTATT